MSGWEELLWQANPQGDPGFNLLARMSNEIGAVLIGDHSLATKLQLRGRPYLPAGNGRHWLPGELKGKLDAGTDSAEYSLRPSWVRNST